MPSLCALVQPADESLAAVVLYTVGCCKKRAWRVMPRTQKADIIIGFYELCRRAEMRRGALRVI